jgi:sugar/nucleoside kinase (ribokinase family)
VARGLFVGLITLDCIYQVEQVPASDEKIVAQQSLLVAGGPATNAAVAFGHLGNEAVLIGSLGSHPLTHLIRADLLDCGVALQDWDSARRQPPPLSTILVTAATGQRAVISRNAVDRQIACPPEDSHGLQTLADLVESSEIVLIDGHQMALGLAVAQLAQQRQIPVVIDAGSWKPGFDSVLSLATSVIAAERFRLPGCITTTETQKMLHQWGISEVATTFGSQPIQLCEREGGPGIGNSGREDLAIPGMIPVPTVSVVDTLGAGDIFHGAFCHYRLTQSFPAALAQAAGVAAQSCQYFGPRAWMQHTPSPFI